MAIQDSVNSMIGSVANAVNVSKFIGNQQKQLEMQETQEAYNSLSYADKKALEGLSVQYPDKFNTKEGIEQIKGKSDLEKAAMVKVGETKRQEFDKMVEEFSPDDMAKVLQMQRERNASLKSTKKSSVMPATAGPIKTVSRLVKGAAESFSTRRALKANERMKKMMIAKNNQRMEQESLYRMLQGGENSYDEYIERGGR